MCDAPAPNELLCIYEWMIFDIFTTPTPIHGHRSHPSYYSDIVMVSGPSVCAVLYLHTFHEAKSKQRNLFCFFLSITKFVSETKIATFELHLQHFIVSLYVALNNEMNTAEMYCNSNFHLNCSNNPMADCGYLLIHNLYSNKKKSKKMVIASITEANKAKQTISMHFGFGK